MRYVYSVIRFVPDTVRGEFINVGLICGSEESSEWDIRTITNQRRARQLDDRGFLPRVWDFIDDIGRKVDKNNENLQRGLFEHEISAKWLEDLSTISNNLLQFTPPAIVVAESIEEAGDLLFEDFIVEPESRRYPRFTKKNAALAAARKAYSEAGLVPGKDFEEGPSVKGLHHRGKFDFIVANGKALQLAQAWSFQIPNQDDLMEQVKAWAWTVSDLRLHGGRAETKERAFDVPKDVDIEVVYVPPAIGGSREALDEALAAFGEVRVKAVETDGANAVGTFASELMAQAHRG